MARSEIKQQDTVWRTLAREYAEKLPGLDAVLSRYRPYICPFDQIPFSLHADATVFDIGCGSGFLLYALNQNYKISEGIGVDANNEKIKTGQRALVDLGHDNIKLISSKSTSDWPNTTFDIVTMVDVLHHIPKSHKIHFLTEALRRVKPGGKFVYKDMAQTPKWKAAANVLHDLLSAREIISYIDIDEVIEKSEHEGFVATQRGDMGVLWYAHEFVVLQKRA